MTPTSSPHNRSRPRVVAALDLDCFYASVAIRSRPHLKHKPVVIVQKHLCVTSNYVARQLSHGAVQKMTPVSKALSICPDLVLIDGSDLTPFRSANQEVMLVIREWLAARVDAVRRKLSVDWFDCPCQKLGFDEVFIDMSRLIECEIAVGGRPWTFAAHLFGRTNDDMVRRTLMVASQLVDELRNKIVQKTQLTLSAGISESKLLAKLAVNMHKPNDQTVFLPEEAPQYIAMLAPRKLPGFGHATEKKLQDWVAKHPAMGNVATACDVINTFGGSEKSRSVLASIIGSNEFAHKILALCRGEDTSPVVESGDAFKSMTSMDSFRKCCTMDDVRAHIRQRATDLVTRLRKDWETHRRRPNTLSVGYRLGRNGFQGTTRLTTMPAEITSLCSSKGTNVRDSAIDALQRAVLHLLSENAGISASQQFDLTWIAIGATNFDDSRICKNKLASTITSFAHKQNSIRKDCLIGKTSKCGQQRAIMKRPRQAKQLRCPICNRQLTGNLLMINSHVDHCLNRGSGDDMPKKARTAFDTRRVDSFFSKT